MLHFRRCCTALVLLVASGLAADAQPHEAGEALVKKIQAELSGPFPPFEAKVEPNVPHGEVIQGLIMDSKIYPGTENHFQVYVPAQYDPARPACLLIKLDGLNGFEATVLDNLIAKKEVPVMIGLGIMPGTVWKDPGGPTQRAAFRFNRSYEFDSMNDHFPDFVLNELLPAVQKMKTANGRAIRISPDGNDHAATGAARAALDRSRWPGGGRTNSRVCVR